MRGIDIAAPIRQMKVAYESTPGPDLLGLTLVVVVRGRRARQALVALELVEVAEIGRIQCEEAGDGPEAALKSFTAFLSKRPDSFLASEAMFGRARCLEQLGRMEEARQIYAEFGTKYTNSVWKSRAEMAMQAVDSEIKRKNGTL